MRRLAGLGWRYGIFIMSEEKKIRADAWQEAFNDRHEFDVYPEHFMSGLRNEFAAGWHAALKNDSSAAAPQHFEQSVEAVAWCRRDTVFGWNGQLINVAQMFPSPVGLKNPIPLYASPQPVAQPVEQTRALTDDQWLEIRRIARTYNETGFPKHAREFLAGMSAARPASGETE